MARRAKTVARRANPLNSALTFLALYPDLTRGARLRRKSFILLLQHYLSLQRVMMDPPLSLLGSRFIRSFTVTTEWHRRGTLLNVCAYRKPRPSRALLRTGCRRSCAATKRRLLVLPAHRRLPTSSSVLELVSLKPWLELFLRTIEPKL